MIITEIMKLIWWHQHILVKLTENFVRDLGENYMRDDANCKMKPRYGDTATYKTTKCMQMKFSIIKRFLFWFLKEHFSEQFLKQQFFFFSAEHFPL